MNSIKPKYRALPAGWFVSADDKTDGPFVSDTEAADFVKTEWRADPTTGEHLGEEDTITGWTYYID